jgi:dienelactone hydrolase
MLGGRVGIAGVLLFAGSAAIPASGQTAYCRADLPPLLEFLDGTPVVTTADWDRRREEIRRLLVETFVGEYPPETPAIVQAEVLEEQRPEDGSRRQRVKVTLGTPKRAAFEMWVWTPRGDGPFPVLLTAPRAYQLGWAEMALQRGYIVGLYPGLDHMHTEPAYPNYETVWNTFRAEYPVATWTEISTKAWLASRALDYLLDPRSGCRMAHGQVAIIGWSRYGKQSLIAAAFDPRITCVVARSAGSPASSPYRFSSHLEGGETPTGFPGDWFLQSTRLYNGRENEMPIDAHGWLALIAPRRCLLHTAEHDDASDLTFAVERAYQEGKKVYGFLGQPGHLKLDYRPGGHGPLTDPQRQRNLDWIDLSFGRGTAQAAAFPEPRLFHAFDWSAWKALQAQDDLRVPPPASAGDRADAIRARIAWTLGRAPERIVPPVAEPLLSRAQEIERYGEDRDPDRWACPDTARVPVVFGEGVRGNLYTSTKANGTAMPVVIWLHNYNWAMGYCSDCEAVIPWGQFEVRTPYHYLASRGYAVLTFDQVGFGTRLEEGRDFYAQYPRWSKLGRMVHDVRAAVDFAVEGRGQAHGEVPSLDGQRVYLLGYSLGGMLALHAAALDARVAGVASFAGFTPFRTDRDAKPTGGIRRFWEWHGLLPKLGLFHGREAEIPHDYGDLLALVAPRPCLIVAPQRDRHADFAEVAACVERARQAWPTAGGRNALAWLSPDDFSHFQNPQQEMFVDWLSRCLAP